VPRPGLPSRRDKWLAPAISCAALSHLPVVRAAPVLLGLSAIIESFAGSLQEAITTTLDGIAASEDPSLSLDMLLGGFGMTVYLADYETMHKLCLRAADFPPVTDTDRFIVAVLTGAAAELNGDYGRARGLLGCAIEIANRLDDAHCLIWVSAGAGRAGNWGDDLPYARRAVRLARERALVSTLPYALEAQASQLLGRGRFDLAYASAEEGRRLALDLGQQWIATWNLTDLASVDAVRGDERQVRPLRRVPATTRPLSNTMMVLPEPPDRVRARPEKSVGALAAADRLDRPVLPQPAVSRARPGERRAVRLRR